MSYNLKVNRIWTAEEIETVDVVYSSFETPEIFQYLAECTRLMALLDRLEAYGNTVNLSDLRKTLEEET